MTLHDAAQVRRRFLLLSATRWLPTGLTIPVLIVLLEERGVSLATIGLVSGLGSLVVALLELPTGGLADALGRRPVLLAAGCFGFYLVHGAANVAHYGLVHRHVGAQHRSTMVSLNSLTSRLGGVIAAPVLGAIAAGQGLPAAFALAAILLALPAPLYALARIHARPEVTMRPDAEALQPQR